MNDRSQSNPQVAHLARMNCTLEAERNAHFDALAGLLQHMKLSVAGRAGLQAPLVCGVPIDDRCLEAAVKHHCSFAMTNRRLPPPGRPVATVWQRLCNNLSAKRARKIEAAPSAQPCSQPK